MAGKCGINTQCYIDSNGINEEEHTVEVYLSDETPVEQYRPDIGKFMLILQHTEESIDLSRKDVMSVFWHHNDRALPLGAYENVRLENKRLKAKAHFDKDDKFAMLVFGKIKKGIIKSLTIGADVLEKTITKDDDGNITVVATRWQPFEGSFTGNPANENAKVGLSNQNQHKEKLVETSLNDVKIFLAKAREDEKTVVLQMLGGANADDIVQLKSTHTLAMTKRDDAEKVVLANFNGAVLDAISMIADDTFSNVSDEDKKVALGKVTLSKDGKFDADGFELQLLRLSKTNGAPNGEQNGEHNDDDDEYAEFDANQMKNL